MAIILVVGVKLKNILENSNNPNVTSIRRASLALEPLTISQIIALGEDFAESATNSITSTSLVGMKSVITLLR